MNRCLVQCSQHIPRASRICWYRSNLGESALHNLGTLTQHIFCSAAELPSAEASQATVSTTELLADPLAPAAAADDVLSDGHVSSSR